MSDDVPRCCRSRQALLAEIRRRGAAGASVRDVAAALARERGLNRCAVYRLVLTLARA
jgi:hypothetical protein